MSNERMKYRKRLLPRLLLLAALFSLFIAGRAHAQFYNGSQLTFGKNRVQHTVDRFWTHYRYPAFDAYFYLGGRDYAMYTARYALEMMPVMERRLDYTLSEKIQFIIFNNLSELKESNIGLLSDETYNIGGVTYIVGTKVFLYFDGSYLNLEKQIRAGLAQVMINEMLYGSEITSQVKNSTLINFPEWYINGLISFIAEDWNVETDNFVRDGVLSGRYRNFNSLSGADAVYAGHSLWKYVADKYGRSSIPNIIYMTKVSRQISNGFLFVIGVPFKTLTDEWMKYFSGEFYQYDDDRATPLGDNLPFRQRKEMVIQQVKLSPDGRYAAYVTNQAGRFRVMLYDSETGKTKQLMRRGHRLDDKVDYSYPIMAWHPSSKLFTFMVEEKAYTWLYSYTIDEDLLERDKLLEFQKVTSFSFNPTGELLVMSAVQRGQSDIYVYSRSSRTSESITRDIYDDFNPRFIDGGSRIVFASTRPSATIVFDLITARVDTHRVIDRMETTDLFVYDFRSRSNLLRRVTNTPAYDEREPLEYQRGYVTYLSDENGIFNRHLARFDSSIAFVDTTTHYNFFTTVFRLSNYRRSLLGHDLNATGGALSSVWYDQGQYRILTSEAPPASTLEGITMTNTTYRMQQLARSVVRKEAEHRDTAATREQKTPESTGTRRFVTVKTTREDGKDTATVNIEDYTFGKGAPATLSEAEARSGFFIPKERVYEVAFSINQLVSQVDLGYINQSYQSFTGGGQPIYINPGINGFIKMGLTDLLEDYRITGGVRLSFNLNNNEYFLSFENLKNRWDKQIILHRKSLESYGYYSIIRRHSHEIHYVLKYPFSNVLAIRNAMILRLDKDVYMGTDLNNLLRSDEFHPWLSGRSELVFDNTRDRGMNTMFGMRGKIFGEYFQKVDQLDQQMVVVGGDWRHYLQIHKTFIWANRLAGSTSFGNNKLIYYMGGVDNWLLPKFNTTINIDQNINWRYQTLATNMRGFQQNIRNGNSFVVLNSEFRMPVFRYFFDRPLRNNFLNNFQAIAFGDFGTAWTGPNPWSEDNALYTQIIEQGPVKVTVKRQVEPFVTGFGFGLRSSLFGYFIRTDWAWGVEDATLTPMVFYLSLGLDF
jgi:hypothetical protein